MAPHRLDLYFLRIFIDMIAKDLPFLSSPVSFSALFGCGELPAEAFRFCPMAQSSPSIILTMQDARRHTMSIEVEHAQNKFADIKNFAKAVRASIPIRTSPSQELFPLSFCGRDSEIFTPDRHDVDSFASCPWTRFLRIKPLNLCAACD